MTEPKIADGNGLTRSRGSVDLTSNYKHQRIDTGKELEGKNDAKKEVTNNAEVTSKHLVPECHKYRICLAGYGISSIDVREDLLHISLTLFQPGAAKGLVAGSL